MSDIKYQKFDKLLKFQPKSKIKAGDGQKNGKYPLFTSSSKLSKFIDNATFKDESLIFGSGGSASIHYCNQDFSTSTDCFVVIQGNVSIELKYIYYFLKSNIQILEVGFKGAGLKHISKKYISNIQIPLQPLHDQKKVASFLTRIENLIQKREKSILLLDELIKSTFLDMFGDPVRNQKEWDLVFLSDICEKVVDCPHSTPTYSSDVTENYCIRSSDIVDGYLDLSKTFQVDDSVYKERIHRYTPQVNDVVYTREGGRLGNAARILNNKNICLGQRMMLFKLATSNSSQFFWALLESKQFKKKILGMIIGGAAPRINIKDLKSLLIINPPYKKQLIFSNTVNTIESIKYSYQKSLIELQNLFNSVAKKAFKGELDVSKIAILDDKISQKGFQVIDEARILDLIKQGDFEAQDHVNECQSYDEIRDLVLKLLGEKKITQRLTDDKKITLKVSE